MKSRARSAAANNADWYEAMFTAHGLRYRRDARGFTALDPPPAYFSALTLCLPEAEGENLARVQQALRPGFGVKDGFAELDLAPLGLRPMIRAEWIWAHPRDVIAPPLPGGWRRVESAEALNRWERAWAAGSPGAGRQFPGALLSDSNVAVFGLPGPDGFATGVIANRSADCIGLSNAFGASALAAGAGLAAQLWPGLPLTGYEWDEDLRQALTAGFQSVGPLTIWTSDTPR